MKGIRKINAGSSSVKLDQDGVTAQIDYKKRVAEAGTEEYVNRVIIKHAGKTVLELDEHACVHLDRRASIVLVLRHMDDLVGIPVAIGHRVVHGGKYTEPQVVDNGVYAYLASLVDLAPLHQRHNLMPMEICRELYGMRVLQVACPDTAFLRSIPSEQRLYAFDFAICEELRAEKYGFHGLSYAYIARKLQELIIDPVDGDSVLIGHWGSGASCCVVRYNAKARAWEAIDCTLWDGTTGAGMLMGTRTPLDADFAYRLTMRFGEKALALMMKSGGLLAASNGFSDSMEDILNARATNSDSEHAFKVWLLHARQTVGGLLFKHGPRPRMIVLTGGIGENGTGVRVPLFKHMFPLVKLDPAKTDFRPCEKEPHRIISEVGSMIAVAVMHTDENAVIEDETLRLYKMSNGLERAA